jgi:hypothetical protein
MVLIFLKIYNVYSDNFPNMERQHGDSAKYCGVMMCEELLRGMYGMVR